MDNNRYQYTGNPGQTYNAGHRKAKRTVNLTRGGIVAIILICMIFSTICGFGGALLAGSFMEAPVVEIDTAGEDATENADTTGFDLEDATGSQLTVQEITAMALDTVVEIRTESVEMDSWMGQYIMEGAGSGVIIREDGYIITNNHVIEGAGNIVVTTSDDKEYTATVVGTDKETDIAVIRIEANDLTAATMGNSDQLNVGDLAVAIGNPLGELGGTVTAGIISSLDRSLTIDGQTMSLMQTDTSINPGNSGGGLFNQDGHLIGIVVAKSSGSDVEGLGFAIPINSASYVAEQLIEYGHVSGKPSTGMSYQDRSKQTFGFSQDTGVYIAEVVGDNASEAGFQPGDLVLSVDGQEIDSFDTLTAVISSHSPGDTVTYVVYRDGTELEINLVLEEKLE